MAGLKAAQTAPTWPDINGEMIPDLQQSGSLVNNLVNNKISIHFIHRSLAYILFLLAIFFFISSKKYHQYRFFNSMRISFFLLIFLQIALGIFTVLHATRNEIFIWLASIHQMVAMMIVMNLVALAFIIRGKRLPAT